MRFSGANGQQQHIRLCQRRLDFGSRHFVKRRRALLRIKYVVFHTAINGHLLRRLFTVCIILGYIVYHEVRNCKSAMVVRGACQNHLRNRCPSERFQIN